MPSSSRRVRRPSWSIAHRARCSTPTERGRSSSRERSALGELLDVDFATMGPMRLYRASDALMAHREAIEHHLFDRAMGLFDLRPTVTLYDLTNTYFEGEAGGQPKARRGHSKEKRTDCPLLTLGLVLDASGFVRRSQVFAGNVREHHTLAALVVMDRGIATEDRVQWLREQGYRYLVVSRERTLHSDRGAPMTSKCTAQLLADLGGRVAPGDCSPEALTRSGQGDFHHRMLSTTYDGVCGDLDYVAKSS